MVDANLSDLHPDLQPLAQAWLAKCNAVGPNVRITETWRNPAREDQLHAEHITALSGSTCKHCFTIDGKPASKAFDFAAYDKAGKYITDGTDASYAAAGAVAESLGLRWGGTFRNPDWDHIELPT